MGDPEWVVSDAELPRISGEWPVASYCVTSNKEDYMLLTRKDADLFFKLHRALMFFVNQRLKLLPDDVASPDAFFHCCRRKFASRSGKFSSLTLISSRRLSMRTRPS